MEKNNKFNIGKSMLYAAGIFIVAFAWILLSALAKNPVIPSLLDIGKSLINVFKDEKFLSNLGSTLKLTAVGIGISIVLGLFFGALNHLSKTFRRITKPILDGFRSVPAIALFPLILCIFGIGDISRIFIIVWTSLPPIILSTTSGLGLIEKTIIEAARIDGASELKILFRIKFPVALPEIVNGIKIGIGTGFISIVVAEMLGATKGIGYMVLWSTNAFKYADVYAYILIISILGILFNVVFDVIIKIIKEKFL